MCIVSEDLEHDVSFVFEVQNAEVKWIKQNHLFFGWLRSAVQKFYESLLPL